MSIVFAVKGRIGEMGRTTAVFAQPSRPYTPLAAESGWNTVTRRGERSPTRGLPWYSLRLCRAVVLKQ